jgi:hypothetical protein
VPVAAKSDARAARRRTLWAAAVCAFASFAATATIALQLDRVAAFSQNNLLFKDDCRSGILAFSEGRETYNAFRHPNLHFLIGEPIRVAVELSDRLVGVDADGLRHLFAILVSPTIGFLFVWATGLTLVMLGIPESTAVLVLMLASVSFSHLLFSSIPTHFAFSGLTGVLLFVLAFRPMPVGWHGQALWFLLGFVATGVSTFNLASWTLFYGWSLRRGGAGRTRVIVQALASAALVIGSTVAAHALFSFIVNGTPDVISIDRNTTRFVRTDSLVRLREFPDALASTFVAADVSMSPAPESTGRRRFMIVLSHPSRWSAAWFGVLCLLAGVAVLGFLGYRRDAHRSAISILAVAQILLCVVFLDLWGDDSLFLYSQHWEPALIILLTGVGLLEPTQRRIGNGVLVVLLGSAAVRSALAWAATFHALAAS